MSSIPDIVQDLQNLKNDILQTCATLPKARELQPDDEPVIHELMKQLNRTTVRNETYLFDTPEWLDYTLHSLGFNTDKNNLEWLSEGVIRIRNVFNQEADKKTAAQKTDWARALPPEQARQQQALIATYSDYARRCDSIARKLLAVRKP